MEKTSQRLLKQSCAWIKEHWNAQNLDVPRELVQKWIYESGDEALRPSGFQLGVFSFGYFQHQLVSKDTPVGERIAVSSKLLLELFQKWQMKLALAEIHRVTDVRTLPLPLFEFSENEEITYWRVPFGVSQAADL